MTWDDFWRWSETQLGSNVVGGLIVAAALALITFVVSRVPRWRAPVSAGVAKLWRKIPVPYLTTWARVRVRDAERFRRAHTAGRTGAEKVATARLEAADRAWTRQYEEALETGRRNVEAAEANAQAAIDDAYRRAQAEVSDLAGRAGYDQGVAEGAAKRKQILDELSAVRQRLAEAQERVAAIEDVRDLAQKAGYEQGKEEAAVGRAELEEQLASARADLEREVRALPLPRPRWTISEDWTGTFKIRNMVARSVAREVHVTGDSDFIHEDGAHFVDLSGESDGYFSGSLTAGGIEGGIHFELTWFDEKGRPQQGSFFTKP
ncbi:MULTISPECIES: hypothetical protein [unclassified Rathayibacter]|uniref:hypothetical protein n=1 Tax=unclassified Rathayibacter TaxID=2609250 RepID=UPI0010480A8F|nr:MULTISPECIES: hypothetical protein [unclassified Rathayibacter]MCJ1703702.1 hypothetical protein [Rathayibacter sp. VKM Ac-2926]